MYYSPTLIRHGIVAIKEEIIRLQAIWDECGDDWPDGFDPNDIGLFDCILPAFEQNIETGFEDEYWSGKPMWFFFDLIIVYLRGQYNQLSAADRLELIRSCSEFQIRHCLGCLENTYPKHPEFWLNSVLRLEKQISVLGVREELSEIMKNR